MNSLIVTIRVRVQLPHRSKAGQPRLIVDAQAELHERAAGDLVDPITVIHAGSETELRASLMDLKSELVADALRTRGRSAIAKSEGGAA